MYDGIIVGNVDVVWHTTLSSVREAGITIGAGIRVSRLYWAYLVGS